MAATCVNCGHKIFWNPEVRRYRHRERDGSPYCESSQPKAETK